MFFWEYNVSCNAGCHQARGVGPATDYEAPWGSPVHAPFKGTAESYWTDEGGWGIRIVRSDGAYTFYAQHLAEKPASGLVNWQAVVAKSGNTGSATTGPHVHSYVRINATGERVSFQYWLEDIIQAGKDTGAVTPPPVPSDQFNIYLPKSWYWYRSAADAQSTRNVHGGRYTGESMLIEGYTAQRQPNGSLKVHSAANGWVYLNSSAEKHRV